MIDRILLPQEELAPFCADSDLAGRAAGLLASQKQTWELLRTGYASLDSIRTRTFQLDGFSVVLQFNPGRIRSSAAKIDAKSISERKCFLCPAHLFPEQRGLAFGDEYILLCNPFPILREHFTIPRIDHVPQLIAGAFPAMLRLARDLGRLYTVFYNGPKCGASAPDHLHFQAGEKGFMPLEREFAGLVSASGKRLSAHADLRVHAFDGLRTMLTLESSDEMLLGRAFSSLLDAMQEVAPAEEEPMVNVLASYGSGAWRVIIFPRSKHRPSFFFADEEHRIMLSPASVDLAGVCVTPVERDFERVTESHLRQMFDEVCLRGGQFQKLSERLSSRLGDL